MVLLHAHRHLLWRRASVVLGCWEHTGFSLGTLHHLAAQVISSRRQALRVVSWSHTPWLDDGAPGRRRRRSPVRDVTRCRWLLRQRASRPVGAPVRDADELGNAREQFLIEISHRAVAKKLLHREQGGLRVHLVASRVG